MVELLIRWQAAVQISRGVSANRLVAKAHCDRRHLERAFAGWKTEQEHSAAQRRSTDQAAEAPHTRLAVQNEVRLWLNGCASTQGRE